jgi:hypothetical protein
VQVEAQRLATPRALGEAQSAVEGRQGIAELAAAGQHQDPSLIVVHLGLGARRQSRPLDPAEALDRLAAPAEALEHEPHLSFDEGALFRQVEPAGEVGGGLQGVDRGAIVAHAAFVDAPVVVEVKAASPGRSAASSAKPKLTVRAGASQRAWEQAG